jgi:hypothetical protein
MPALIGMAERLIVTAISFDTCAHHWHNLTYCHIVRGERPRAMAEAAGLFQR